MTRRQYPIPPPERVGLTLEEVAGLTGLGLASVRHAIGTGLLQAHRLGRRVNGSAARKGSEEI
jgi:hypothetical protein